MNIRFTISDGKHRPYYSLLDSGINAYMPIPLPDYDKTFYLYDEKDKRLIACKILKVVIGSLNTYTRPFLWLETPNGKKQVEYNSAILLESKEDFMLYMQGLKSKYRFEEKKIREMFPNYIIHTCRDLLFYPSTKKCWVFKNGRAEKDSVTMHYLTFDKKGCEVCFLSTSDNLKVYLSQEDCLKDNVVDVVEFDEEETQETPLMDASNNHDPQLVEKINSCYNIRRIQFCQIVRLLAERDNAGYPKEWNVTEVCKAYCQNIADNKDLQTILSFCGW